MRRGRGRGGGVHSAKCLICSPNGVVRVRNTSGGRGRGSVIYFFGEA